MLSIATVNERETIISSISPSVFYNLSVVSNIIAVAGAQNLKRCIDKEGNNILHVCGCGQIVHLVALHIPELLEQRNHRLETPFNQQVLQSDVENALLLVSNFNTKDEKGKTPWMKRNYLISGHFDKIDESIVDNEGNTVLHYFPPLNAPFSLVSKWRHLLYKENMHHESGLMALLKLQTNLLPELSKLDNFWMTPVSSVLHYGTPLMYIAEHATNHVVSAFQLCPHYIIETGVITPLHAYFKHIDNENHIKNIIASKCGSQMKNHIAMYDDVMQTPLMTLLFYSCSENRILILKEASKLGMGISKAINSRMAVFVANPQYFFECIPNECTKTNTLPLLSLKPLWMNRYDQLQSVMQEMELTDQSQSWLALLCSNGLIVSMIRNIGLVVLDFVIQNYSSTHVDYPLLYAARDNQNNTIVHAMISRCGCQNALASVIDSYFKACPALLHATNNDGDTALHLVTRASLKTLATCMIRNGADVNAKNSKNEVAYEKSPIKRSREQVFQEDEDHFSSEEANDSDTSDCDGSYLPQFTRRRKKRRRF